MPQLNVHEAKTHLSRLLDGVSRGESFVIARAGIPVADLIPHRSPDIVFGTWDITIDHDAFTQADAEVADLLYAAVEQ